VEFLIRLRALVSIGSLEIDLFLAASTLFPFSRANFRNVGSRSRNTLRIEGLVYNHNFPRLILSKDKMFCFSFCSKNGMWFIITRRNIIYNEKNTSKAIVLHSKIQIQASNKDSEIWQNLLKWNYSLFIYHSGYSI